MNRTYNPDLDIVYVQRNGTILWDGEAVGYVWKIERGTLAPGNAKWRAEVGDPANPEAWPRYRSLYAMTRADAVNGALEGVEVPS